MRKVDMKLIGKRQLATDTFELKLKDKYISQTAIPGQFIYISLPNFTLRRPISIADVSPEQGEVTITFKIMGKGTAELAACEVGRFLDCIGPRGNGFPLGHSNQRVLLIGGGIGVPPLYYLGKELKKRGNEVTSILGFQTGDYVFYENEFSKLGETCMVTDDGTYGEKGYVTDHLPANRSFDMYYSCGPRGMLAALQQELMDKPGYLSLEERMGCGVGACAACVVPTKDGGQYLKICHDGPVFEAREVIL